VLSCIKPPLCAQETPATNLCTYCLAQRSPPVEEVFLFENGEEMCRMLSCTQVEISSD